MVIKLMLSGDNISVGVIKSRCVAVGKVVPFRGQFNSWVMGVLCGSVTIFLSMLFTGFFENVHPPPIVHPISTL